MSPTLRQGTATVLKVLRIWSWIIASYQLGGIVGSLFIGHIASGLGRRGGLVAGNALVVLPALLMGAAKARCLELGANNLNNFQDDNTADHRILEILLQFK